MSEDTEPDPIALKLADAVSRKRDDWERVAQGELEHLRTELQLTVEGKRIALRDMEAARGERDAVCVWKEDDEGYWGTGCGQAFVFNDGGPKDNEFRFCYHCGKPISQPTPPQPSPQAGEE